MKIKDIYHYSVGNYRYWIYHSKRFGFLMRSHIRSQINFRIDVMDMECYVSGECKICGCETTALQMANKPCGKPCYPEMLYKNQWKSLMPTLKRLYENDIETYLKVIIYRKTG